jgi:aminopeptidase
MNLRTMKKYAQAVVELGVNVKEGQYVVINSSIRQSKFVHCLVEECYKRKARFVKVEYSDDEVSKLTYKNVEEKTYIENTKQNLYRLRNYTKILPVQIYVEDSDPDVFKGIDISKAMKARIKTYPKVKKYRDMMENRYQWVIVAMPSKEWAKKVFPNDTPSVAFKKLEDAILKTTRIDNNAVNNWKEHIKELQEKSQILNDLNLDYLEYKSSNGTDLKLKLMPNHQWISARENALGSNIDFTANMPTEEVFSMPSYDGVDGVVVSTKPLSLRGKLVEDFKVYFEKGRAYKVEARVGQEVLEELLSDDEGSRHLGEVALVPYNSPINESGILFFNTLFDENASCHLAFGAAFKNNIKGYETMTDEDFKKMKFNESMNHVDFMIGSKDLSIIGTKFDGTKVQIFKDGNWAI